MVSSDFVRAGVARSAAARSTFATAGPPRIKAQWLSATKRKKLGQSFALDLPAPAMAEAFAVDGTIRHVEVDPVLQFDDQPPAGAAYLKLDIAGKTEILERFLLAGSSLPKPETKLFPEVGGTFIFPIFAERFTDRDYFFNLVEQLYEWIVSVPPFNRDDVKQAFALHAHYWATDPVRGQFQTEDFDFHCVRDRGTTKAWPVRNDLAVPALRPLMREGKYGLVLIDSDVRGGAGGIAEHACPAWASRSSCAGETWFSVVLHEIGHSLELADEYVQESLSDRPFFNETNVARNADLQSTGWKAMFSERPVSAGSIYTIDDQRSFGKPGGRHRPDDEFVGLFAGAHYREDCYRPSLKCLMLRTDHPHFCPVCSVAIVAKLTGKI